MYVYIFFHQIHHKYSPNMEKSWNKITDLLAQNHVSCWSQSHRTSHKLKAKETNKYTIFSFFSYLIQIASVFKLFNLLWKFEAVAYIWLRCEIRHNTSKGGCLIITEACFSFCSLYIIPGFSPISILVDIGEVRGNVYFSNWANQNNFCSKHRGLQKALQPPIQCQPDTWQSWGSVRGAWGLRQVCLWAWDGQSCAEEAFSLTSLASCLIWNGWKGPGNQVTGTKLFLQGSYLPFSIAWSHIQQHVIHSRASESL